MPRLFALIFFMLFALSYLPAQDDESMSSLTPSGTYAERRIERRDFDEKKWETLKDGIDYGRPKPKKEEAKKEEAPQKKQEEAPEESLGISSFFKVLALLIVVGLLVFLIVKLAGGDNPFGPKNTKLKPAVSASELEKIEENLHEAELEDPIRRAIAAGDYPMAVRLYYLSVLKELAVRNHIRWKRDKTNGAYLRELAGSNLYPTVQAVTLAFERVWYGKVELTKQDFEQLELKLKKAVATVSTT